jgi:hypothetical protein
MASLFPVTSKHLRKHKESTRSVARNNIGRKAQVRRRSSPHLVVSIPLSRRGHVRNRVSDVQPKRRVKHTGIGVSVLTH